MNEIIQLTIGLVLMLLMIGATTNVMDKYLDELA